MDQMENIEIIERYLNNELSLQERQDFEKLLREDESLKAEFTQRQTAHRILDIVIAQNLKEQLNTLEEESKVVPIGRGRRIGMYRIAAAASVLLLIGMFTFLFQGGDMSPSELAEAHYTLPSLNIQRSSDPALGQENELTRGKLALQRKTYDQAILTLDSISSEDPYYIEAQYYMAHAYYLTGQYREAEERFTEVSASDDTRYNQDADWYGLLACLHQDADCDQRLSEIADNTSHAYHEQATEISTQLK